MIRTIQLRNAALLALAVVLIPLIGAHSSTVRERTLKMEMRARRLASRASQFGIAYLPVSSGWGGTRTTAVDGGRRRRVFGARNCLMAFLILYILLFAILTVSHRAQTYFIYLHWLRPPNFLFPLQTLGPYRLASSARVVSQGNLRGWHLLPPGPPFTDGSDRDFNEQLSAPRQRVIMFFHGNSGTRACPGKRVTMLKMLGAHFMAHVVSFDYSGFGDSSGRPSEEQFYRDAREMYEWVRKRVAPDSDIVLYGQSLGSFAVVDLAVYLCNRASVGYGEDLPTAVVLDAAPASLVDAAMTHPVGKLFRVLPRMEAFFRWVLKESLDSTKKVSGIKVPLLILHGDMDSMISLEQGEKLYAAAGGEANENVEFVRFAGRGHNDVNSDVEYLRSMHRFLEKHLKVKMTDRL